MKSKLKRTLAFTASLAMCSMTLLHFPDGTFSIPLTASAAEGDVEISEENFPDETFRIYVNDKFDTTDDDVLKADEIAAVTHIDVCNMGITNLTGVEFFTALTELDCSYNQLTSLDMSKNTALETLNCYSNQLTSLDVSDCTALKTLNCYSNQLTSLDVSDCTALKTLRCFSNQLTSLDVSNNTALEHLYCYNNQLTSLNVSNNTALKYLDCDNNQLKSLDVSDCTALKNLLCNGNQLQSLDLTKNTALVYLDCTKNPLLAVNAVTGITSYYNASSLTAFAASTPILRLADYGIKADMITSFTGCELSTDGNYLLLTGDGTASYTYDVDGENGVHTISASIGFPAGIKINEENFPDETFRDYVSGNIDTNNDTVLTADEIAAVTEIDLWSPGITTVTNLTGVEYFTALTELDCGYNQLTSLDVSNNTALETLFCDNNQLTSLDVSKNTALEYLICSDNQLTSLDVSNCTALTNLDCFSNQLTSLNVSDNTALVNIACNDNPLLSLNGVSSNITYFTGSPLSAFLTAADSVSLSEYDIVVANISNFIGGEIVDGAIVPTTFPGTVTYTYDAGSDKTISCTIKFGIPINEENFPDAVFREYYVDQKFDTTDDDFLDADEIAAVTEIDVHGRGISDLTGVEYFTALTYLDCYNNALTSLDVSQNTALKYLDCAGNSLTSLDVSQNTALTFLDCAAIQLTSLDVSQNTALTTLDCSVNQLTSLDVSQNTALKYLDCSANQLTSLDVSQNTALKYLYCSNNKLTSLDVSKNTVLTELDCSSNQLISLDVSQNTELQTLDCNSNQLTSLDVSKNEALTFLSCYGNQLTSLDVSKNTALGNLYCMNNPLLAVNAVTGITNYYNASPLNAFAASNPVIRLADYGIKADMITSFTGCELSTDGNYLLLTGDGTASYTYDVDGENGEHTLSASIEFPAGIEINEENFPDEIFRTYVDENFDKTNDDILDAKEIAAVTEISVSDKGISDLTGVEFFTALESLYCHSNQLTSLDISKNVALTFLSCYGNQLTSLDVSNNTALTFLSCDSNQLTSLDVSKNTALTYLDCSYNQLTSLDLSNNTALEILYCDNNQLTSLDVSNNTALTELNCSSNQLTSLDVSKNTALETLYCNNNQLTSLDVSKNTALEYLNCSSNQLTSLDVSNNTALETLYCYENQLTSLDVSKNTALINLNFSYNQLTSLDVSNNTALNYLDCSYNQLTSLDVSNNTTLNELFCSRNQLTSLNVDGCAALETLYCYENQLTSLNVDGCAALITLNCSYNQLTSLDLSQNTNLNNVDCSSNSYSIDLVGGTFDLSKLPEGFDIAKASGWLNATVEGNILTVSDPTSDISYTYDLGNGSTAVFALKPVSCTLSEDMVSKIEEQVYSGETLEPVTIICGEYTLIEDVDYTITYENNVSTGTASAVITGTGDFYTGEVTVEFTITPKPIETLTIDVTAPAVGETPQDTVADGDGYTAVISWEPDENPFDYNTVYIATIILTPDSNHVFDGNTTADGFAVTLNEDGTLTLTKEFEATDKAKITVLTPPGDMTLTGYYTNPDDVLALLPTTIEIEAEDGTSELAITWEFVGEFCTDSDAQNAFVWTADIGDLDANGYDIEGTITVTNIEYVAINEANFPDEIFRSYVDENFDTTDDDILDSDEIEAVTGINVYDMGISDLTGVEYFTSLTYLNCSCNNLTSLDVSKNTELFSLACEQNNLTALDISKNVNLERVFTQYNQLTSLDVSANTLLIELRCQGNAITVLDVSQNTALTYLDCDENQLTSLDASQNTALTYLDCGYNQLTSLDVSQNTALTYLDCSGNQLTSLDVSKNTALIDLSCGYNQLASIDVSNNTALIDLRCGNNQLESLNVSNNTALTILYCYNNQLTVLDVSKNTELEDLLCESNQLTALDLSNNLKLERLWVQYNPLTELDVSQLIALTSLYCYGAKLTSLDVTQNTALEVLYCDENQLTSLDVSKNTALTYLDCYPNSYAIDLIGGTFDLTALPEGFDITKASEWENATVEGNILTVSDLSLDVTYVYDLGNGSTEIFTLTPVSCTLTEDMIQPIGTQTYTGEPIRPVVLKYGDYTLVEDTDYNIGYALNVEAGTSAVNITAIGDFWKGELTTEFVIEKATPDYEIPTDLTATYGDTLADVELPEGFTWQDDLTTSVGSTGENTFTVTFTPEDTNNYEIVENIEVMIAVAKADPIVTPLLIGTEFFEGDDLPEITVSDDSTLGWIEWAADIEVLEAGENILEWHYTPEDTENYNEMTGTMIVEAQATTESDTTEPTTDPTEPDTTEPTTDPTEPDTTEHTTDPTEPDTTEPTTDPTEPDTTEPTTDPTEPDTTEPTTDPTEPDTTEPTTEPTEPDTTEPTTEPTELDTTEPTTDPTELDTTEPTTDPTEPDTTEPTTDPTEPDTTEPTTDPTEPDTTEPTTDPTEPDTTEPTTDPTEPDTTEPTTDPTEPDTTEPTTDPTEPDTTEPTTDPTEPDTTEPTTDPTEPDTTEPTTDPTEPDTTETIETTEPTQEPELPQTGYSVIYHYIMLAAAAMVLFGIGIVVLSRRKEQDDE